MQSEKYRDSLKDALENLFEVNRILFNSLIPIAMAGELEEWSDSVPTGETHSFSFELFRNCQDSNIQLLVKLIENVDEAYLSIKNVNGIEMEEDFEE